MQIDYKNLMANKSDEGLMTYLEKIEIYTEEAVMAAMRELQKRGRQFSELEQENIKLRLDEKRNARINEDKKLITNSWTKNIVTDPNAPEYYSHRAIWMFSTIFSVIFGAALLSSNLKSKGSVRWIVWGYGIVYTGLIIFLLSFIPRNTGLTVGLNGAGAWIMNQIFWNKYLGEETKYRTKAIWKPLIISIVITIPVLLAIIYGG